MVNIEGYEIPNQPQEISVEQFDKINFITQDTNLDEIEKWVEKLVYLGVNRDVFDDMDLETFYSYIAQWNDQPPHPTDKVLEIELDGYKYVAKPTIGVKDLGMIEKVWNRCPSRFTVRSSTIGGRSGVVRFQVSCGHPFGAEVPWDKRHV